MEQPETILDLPEETEVETSEEIRLIDEEGILRKTIRYRDGLVVILHQDFINNVFKIELRSSVQPFWISRNRIFRVR